MDTPHSRLTQDVSLSYTHSCCTGNMDPDNSNVRDYIYQHNHIPDTSNFIIKHPVNHGHSYKMSDHRMEIADNL